MAAALDLCVYIGDDDEAAQSSRALTDLPLDVHLRLLSLLDGRSLAAFAEGTSREFAGCVGPYLGPFWQAHAKSAVAAVPSPSSSSSAEETAAEQQPYAFLSPRAYPPPLPAEDAAECKSQYVRAMARVEQRCARCGRQSAAGRRGSGEVLDDAGRYQSHLCDWFVPRRRN